MFQELMPLLAQRVLLLTLSRGRSNYSRHWLGALDHRNLVFDGLPGTTSATSFIVHFIHQAYSTPQLCMLSVYSLRNNDSGG
jgi:hypothetical protein